MRTLLVVLALAIPMVAAPNDDLASTPPPSWNAQDPADSLYQSARTALNQGNYSKASYLFARIHDEHPKSTYAPEAYYWEALALYRVGSRQNLERARDVLSQQRSQFPNARTRADATDLRARVDGALARQGDERAVTRVQELAESATLANEQADQTRAERDRARSEADPSRTGRSAQSSNRCRDDDDDVKSAALNAFLNMDAARALPILEKVMARRDAGSECLRRKAVFLISQHAGPQSESMLLRAARTDPDREVKEQAIFWLGQSGGERAAVALDSILRHSDDRAVQDKAIFALSQNSSSRAQTSLRDYAMRADAPIELRGNAIFWLGQTDGVEYLKTIYPTVQAKELREKIVFAVAQGGGAESAGWLAAIARNKQETVAARKNAIFWLGQAEGTSITDLTSLYNSIDDRDIKESLIFAYSQRNDRAAVDKLFEIAKSDPDRELRKKAVFWLSQSKDPRVAAFLEEILTKP